jgi:hypothetical protein
MHGGHRQIAATALRQQMWRPPGLAVFVGSAVSIHSSYSNLVTFAKNTAADNSGTTADISALTAN